MGRLENFVPIPHKFNLEKDNDGKFYLSGNALQSFEVPEKLVPFIRNLNGHLSLREIMIFLNRKKERIFIKESLRALEKLAERGYLHNGQDFLKIYSAPSDQPGQRLSPFQTNLTKAYFSKARLLGLLQKTTLFMKCDHKVAENILKHASLEKVDEKTRIIKKGTKSRHFFILLSGEVGIYKRGEMLASLGNLSVFGESAAIFDRERNADVSTLTECWLLKINATELMDVKAKESFDFMNSLRSRLILNQTMASNPLFTDVPADIMQLFLSKCRIEKHAKESTIIKQGDTHGEFYFILKGSVMVMKDGIPVTSLAEGEHFGEIAAIFREPRTATIITESECVFLSMTHQALMEVLCSHFRLAISIEKTAAARRQSDENVFSQLSKEFTASGLFDSKTFNTFVDIDDSFIEITETNFDMQVLDFTKQESTSSTPNFQLESLDDDEEAS